MGTEGQREKEDKQCQSKELLGIQKDAFLRVITALILSAPTTAGSQAEHNQGKEVGGKDRGLPYLIVVKVEHVSPPGPHPGIGEVGVTSGA